MRPEKLGDRLRCPRAVEVWYIFRHFGGLGQRSPSHSFLLLLVALLMVGGVQAETGYDAWLRYAPVESSAMPAVIVTFGDSKLVESARQEAIRGVRGMLGRTLRVETGLPNENAIVLGTLADLRQLHLAANLKPDGYLLKTVRVGPVVYTVVSAANDRGVLYGTVALLGQS
jgi:alpha-glucuronidase